MPQLKIFVSHSHEDNAFCQQLVVALKQSSPDVNVWYDDYNLGSGNLLDVIEKEMRNRPVFIVILSPAALKSQWVRNETSWAFSRYQRDPERIILPVVAQAVDLNDIWLFIEPFKRIEAQYGVPYPTDEAIRKTLDALYLGKGEALPVRNDDASLGELLQRGKLLVLRGKFQEATESFTLAHELQPNNIEISFELGQNYRNLNRLDEMEKIFIDILEVQPTSALEWHIRSTMQALLKREDEALKSIEMSLSLDNSSSRAWNIKGNLLVDLMRYDEAMSAYDKSLSLDPMNSIIWGNKAIAFVYMGHYHSALMSADIALRLDNETFTARQNRGWALLGLGRFKEALENCMDIHSAGVTDVESWYCGALALFCMGRKEEGEFWLSKAGSISVAFYDIPFEFKDGVLTPVAKLPGNV